MNAANCLLHSAAGDAWIDLLALRVRRPGCNVEVDWHVSLFFISVYALAYFGVWLALLTPPIVSLALRVAEIDPANKEINLSWVLGAGAVVAMLTNPIAGLLSDRTTARMGMRRPWLIGGMALGLAGLYMIATGNLLIVIIGWCIAQLGFNSLLAAFVAILPDQVPEKQRGTVCGVLGVSLKLGIVAGVYLTGAVGGSMFMMFMLPGGHRRRADRGGSAGDAHCHAVRHRDDSHRQRSQRLAVGQVPAPQALRHHGRAHLWIGAVPGRPRG